jgi:hypothetical protein
VGLSERLARHAAGHPRPFVVAAPGGTGVRLAVEAELRRRGWRVATSPAETELLLVCGEPGAALDAAIETLWQDIPGPRARVRLPVTASAEEIVSELDGASAELADLVAQRADALTRLAEGPWTPSEPEGDPGPGMASHANHHGADQGAHDHGGHEHHMGAPAGLAMAERARDRDGLKLDVLRVPLGPVLPCWPAGLRVNVTLQGDVVQAAEVEVLDGWGGGSFWDEPWLAARAGTNVTAGVAARRTAGAHLDSLGRLLAVAGWPTAAARAFWLRDDVLADRPGGEVAAAYAAFARRTGRSRLLRWMTRDVGVVDDTAIGRHGLTGPAARYPGDVDARLRGWLAATGEAMAHADDDTPLDGEEGPRGPVSRTPSAAMLAMLPGLLDGAEFSAARLIVASLDPDADQLPNGAIDA